MLEPSLRWCKGAERGGSVSSGVESERWSKMDIIRSAFIYPSRPCNRSADLDLLSIVPNVSLSRMYERMCELLSITFRRSNFRNDRKQMDQC